MCDANFSYGSIEQNEELLDIDWYSIENIVEKLTLAQVTMLVVEKAIMYLENNTKSSAKVTIPTYSRRKGKRVIRYKFFSK